MFAATLKLPATFKNTDIETLGDGLNAVSQTAMRDDNHRDAAWRITWNFDEKPAATDLKARLCINAEIQSLTLPNRLDIEITPIPERSPQEWLAESYKEFPPQTIGPFFIHGSHYDGAIPDAKIALQIDAATAFGSGEHGTTAGCLNAMTYLKDQGLCPWNILDMGTGSGILAIAAWKLWKTPILAVDNDPESITVTKHHATLNKIPAELTCEIGDGFAADIVQQKSPFELIIANILAAPLRDMAADLCAVLDDNGYVILSGILNEQADSVIKTYTTQGLTLHQHNKIGDWSTLILHNARA